MTNHTNQSLRSLALITGVLLAGAVSSASAAVRYVNAGAATLGNGTSWAQAMPHLSDALAASQSGDEIWVVTGTYYPDTSGNSPSGTADRATSFTMKSGVGIYGGFVGSETARAQRNPATNLTVLSGDIGTPNAHADNSYNVLEANNVSTSGILDGFTIRRGQANGPTDIATYSGGGLYVHSGGKPTINNCRFEDNWARGGGAVSVQTSSAVVTNCTFLRNFGDNRAGCIEFTTSSNAIISNCTFDSNVSYFGGALYFNQSSVGGLVDRCTFVDNDSVNGGAMFLAGFSTTATTNCLFLRNECKQLTFFQTSFDGGAVKNWCTSSAFINCVFNGNRARGTGGAIVDAGPSGSHATIVNCTIYGNYSRDGGAVGALSGHTPNLRNSIVWANTADGANPISIVGGVVIASSNVQGLSPLTGGNANVDPQFNAPNGSDGTPATADDNLTLLGTSLLIDAGNNSLVPAGIITDFAGQGRFIDGNNDTIQTVDMGAFEYITPPPPHCYGDADGNLIVNFSDITKILSNWGLAGPTGDSDDSGIVNFADITATLTAWGSDCNPA